MATQVTDADSASQVDGAPAGWYPTSDRVLRWWDGNAWTDDVHRTRVPIEGTGPQPRPVHPAAVASMVLTVASLIPVICYVSVAGLIAGKYALSGCEPKGPWGGRRMAEIGVRLSQIVLIVAVVIWLIALAAIAMWMTSFRG